MVQLIFRQVRPGGTLEEARTELLPKGLAGYFVDSDGTRRFTIGDGVRTLGQLIDAGETFDIRGGLSILSGEGPPDDELGRNGELYFDVEGLAMWGPKVAGTWDESGPRPIGEVVDHGALAGLDGDDHSLYLTIGRANTWLATKTLDAVVDSATRLAMTSAERTKLTSVEANAKDDQTGAEIVAAINAELAGTSWQAGGSTPAPDSITNTELANMVEATFKGRAAGAGTGDPTDLSASQARTILNVADGANAYSHPNHSGDVTSTGDGATSIAAGAVVEAKIGTGAVTADKIGAGAVVEAKLGTGAVTAGKIGSAAVTLAKMESIAQERFIGGAAGAGTVAPQHLTPAQARTILNVADGANAYTHPNHSGDVTSSGDGATTIANNAVSDAKLRDSAALSVIGRSANSTGDPADIAGTDGQALRVSGTTLGFGTIVAAGIASDAVTTAKIQDAAVTLAKQANLAADSIVGRANGAGTGVPQALTATQARTILNVADGANAYAHPNHSGDVTSSGDGATTIAANAVTDAKLRDSAALSVIGRSANSTGDPADIAGTDGQALRVAGTTLGFGTIAAAGIASDAVTTAKIQDAAVTLAKQANLAADTFIGRANGGGTGVPQALTATQARTILNVADGANAYTHPNHSGDVTSTGDGATSIASNAVTNAKLRDSAALSVIGRSANSSGDPADIAGTDGQALRVSGTTLGFGTIAAAGIASDAVTTAKILDANVTLAKMANLAADTIVGRANGAGTGVPQALTATQLRTIIDLVPTVGTNLTVPAGYPVTPLILPRRTARGWTGSVSARSLRNTTGVIYYVDITNGSDANAGTSAASPLKSIEIALEKSDVGTVKVAPGVYRWGNTWGTPTYTISATAAYNVERWPVRPGPVLITTAAKNPTWAADGTYAHCYRATIAFAESVIDIGVRNPTGDGYLPYDEATTLALCSAQPGSWFWDSGSGQVVVNPLRAGSAPGHDVLVMQGFNAGVDPASRRSLYMEGLTFMSGNNGFIFNNTTGSNGGRVVAVRCNFMHNVNGGSNMQGCAESVFEDCVAVHNGGDGLGHSVVGSQRLTNGVEIRCRGDNNGVSATSGTSNGFSVHDGMNMVRIACTATGNAGPQFADTGSGTEVLMVGCYAGQASVLADDTQSAGFQVLNGTTTWLHDCESRSNRNDLVIASGGTAYTDRCDFSTTTNAGTLGTYSQT